MLHNITTLPNHELADEDKNHTDDLAASEEYIQLIQLIPHVKGLYQYIVTSEEFDHPIKTAAFFMTHHEKLKQSPFSREIDRLLSEVKPLSHSKHLKKMLRSLGAYSFLSDKEKNITIGVEIEFSNIRFDYRKLAEFVMNSIQAGWSHPGDCTVTPIGENTYRGESTTPIIYNNKDLKFALLNVAFLHAMKAKTNKSCGLHIHIGVKNLNTPDEYKTVETVIEEVTDNKKYCPTIVYTNYQFAFIKQFLMIYKREEIKFSPQEREYNKRIKAITIIPVNIESIKNFNALQKTVSPDREYELNLLSLKKHGTIEVRRFSGTTAEPNIFATMAMIHAMAKEAKARTNFIFSKMLCAQSGAVDDNLLLSCLAREKTELQTDLVKLRVNKLNESKLLIPAEIKSEELEANTVYINLGRTGAIEYEFYDKNGTKKTGSIEDDGRFSNIIQKLRSNASLSAQESNLILCEVSMKINIPVSGRVKKIGQTLRELPMLFGPRHRASVDNMEENTNAFHCKLASKT